MNETLAVGKPVQHRAWFWTGTIAELPDWISPISHIKVKKEDGELSNEWYPALNFDPLRFVYDFSKEDDADEDEGEYWYESED